MGLRVTLAAERPGQRAKPLPDELCGHRAAALEHPKVAGRKAPAATPGGDLWSLLETLIAGDPVPLRPGRSEPRVIKRRPSPYPLLTAPRQQMKVIPYQKKYRRPDPILTVLS